MGGLRHGDLYRPFPEGFDCLNGVERRHQVAMPSRARMLNTPRTDEVKTVRLNLNA